MNIKKIKTTIEQCREELIEYIRNAGSLRRVEENTGVDRAHLSKYLNGKIRPKLETLVEIAEKIETYKNKT
ncbi:XRE family transcriptional regulator (plasmid) [Leptospira mayottensis]|uniref:XRE family transcriptional regulator n=1 Tax=Leptospira mayottensis 200901116 TaxID=1192864 RepID=M6VM82_9LEPT|nr:helix-turn-helix transcriptional regulator [Leptospira mayottensis]AVH81624.1 XRE family transcriptional regulator [Leptospira mayottensis 200901116]AXR62863.1 XRE family transcriptional regulator [Leptospira mayottensis]TGN00387.1 XRE family transcriptional regulator [Leptospira mayottensis]